MIYAGIVTGIRTVAELPFGNFLMGLPAVINWLFTIGLNPMVNRQRIKSL